MEQANNARQRNTAIHTEPAVKQKMPCRTAQRRSKWRLQKNNLPQGTVFSPILFNIYTSDQPIYNGTMIFIYADDPCITSPCPLFTEVKDTTEEALSDLSDQTHQRKQSACKS